MKKILIILVAIIAISAGGYFIYDYPRIRPLMLKDITGVESSNLEVAIGVSFEDTVVNVQPLGYLNWNRGEGWKDENRYVDGKERPLVVTVSNQQGPVPSQILAIRETIEDKERIFKVYLPALSGEGGSWAWFYIDSAGSSYWGCEVGETCDGGVKGSQRALREENVARKAPKMGKGEEF